MSTAQISIPHILGSGQKVDIDKLIGDYTFYVISLNVSIEDMKNPFVFKKF